MPQLAIIEGLPKVGLYLPNLNNNVGLSGLDIGAWTPAELHLLAIKRSLILQATYHGDPKGDYKKGITQLENAITGKVNEFSFLGIQSSALEAVNRNINYAKTLVRKSDSSLLHPVEPGQKFQSFGYGINSVAGTLSPLHKEKWIWNYFKTQEVIRTDTTDSTIKSDTNDYTGLTKEHIRKYIDVGKASQRFGIGPVNSPKDLVDKIWKHIGDEYLKFNKWRSALYDKYEPTAHHVLYEFIENYTSESGTVQAKRINHRAALEAISKAAHIDRATMTVWTDNGVNAAYLKAYSEPIGGKESIEVLRSVNQPKIGIAPLVIITAITAALTAANELLKTVKGTPEGDVLSTVNQYGLPSNQPNPDDFPPPANPDSTDTNNNESGEAIDYMKYLPFALVGAAGLYYLTNRK